jgi:hypothetical protein
MMNRTNLLAAAITLAGAATLPVPRPLHATWVDPKELLVSCCRASGPFGELMKCCSLSGCMIDQYGCTKL